MRVSSAREKRENTSKGTVERKNPHVHARQVGRDINTQTFLTSFPSVSQDLTSVAALAVPTQQRTHARTRARSHTPQSTTTDQKWILCWSSSTLSPSACPACVEASAGSVAVLSRSRTHKHARAHTQHLTTTDGKQDLLLVVLDIISVRLPKLGMVLAGGVPVLCRSVLLVAPCTQPRVISKEGVQPICNDQSKSRGRFASLLQGRRYLTIQRQRISASTQLGAVRECRNLNCTTSMTVCTATSFQDSCRFLL